MESRMFKQLASTNPDKALYTGGWKSKFKQPYACTFYIIGINKLCNSIVHDMCPALDPTIKWNQYKVPQNVFSVEPVS